MLGITKHIKLLSSVAVLLFAFGSSGLTVVLHYCTMPQMACCVKMDDDGTAGSRQTGVPSIQSDMNCSSSTLVGGYTTNAGIVDNNRSVHKISVDILPACNTVIGSQTVAASFSVRPFAENFSPPSVEKHILNATLLI